MEDWLTLVEVAAGLGVVISLELLVTAFVGALVVAVLRYEQLLSFFGLFLLLFLLGFKLYVQLVVPSLNLVMSLITIPCNSALSLARFALSTVLDLKNSAPP